MNYFDFFEIPFSLSVDEKLLKRKFYANSKKFHPDFFTLEGIEQQMHALEQSTLNNKAYNALIDFDKRLHHMLTSKSILEDEGNNSLPQEFLMEMMDVNEAVMELQFDFDNAQYQKIIEQIEETKEQLLKSIDHIIPKQEGHISDVDYDDLKNYYLKSKYLNRLTENIDKLKP